MTSAVTTLNLSGANNTASNGFHSNGNNSLSTTTQAGSSSNVYRIGDFVYIESSPGSPYNICKIEELVKNQNGNVEVKAVCFYRRRDISQSLIKQCALEEEQDKELETLPENIRHQIKLRQLYLTRQIETFAANNIRGRCTIVQLSEAETPSCYLEKDDAFYYTFVYDPEQKSLSPPERGDIRVGSRYQAEVPPKMLDNPDLEDTRHLKDLETLVYNPEHHLTDQEIEQFLTVAKSLGTFARALDCSSSIKEPSLHMSAAAASRDSTVQHAMDTLHRCDYDIAKAVLSLVPNNTPILCRDEIEEWSAAEASMFEEAFEKYEKKFLEIRQNHLPWKTQKNLIEYYYMWKTTDRYVQQKRVKAVENENRLKQIYIPNFNKQNALNGSSNDQNGGRQCESCKKTSSNNWNAWGPSQHASFLCQSCWNFWRKFGGLKYPNRLADVSNEKLIGSSGTASQTSLSRPSIADLNSQYPCRECNKVFNRQERLIAHMATHKSHKCNVSACGKEFKFKAHLQRHCSNSHGGGPVRAGSPRPIMKTRAAFYFSVVPSLRLSRRLCSEVLNLKHAARYPFVSINVPAYKQEYFTKYSKGVSQLPRLRSKNRGKVTDISHRLGTPTMPKPEWLIALPKDQLPQPKKLAFPRIPIEEDLRNKDFEAKNADNPRKRSIDQNGNSLPSKRRQMAPPSILGKSLPDLYENISKSAVSTAHNGRAKIATLVNVSGQSKLISWVDAPDDVYFVANDKIKQMRRKVTLAELRRAARRPWKRCATKGLVSNTNALPTSTNTGAASVSHSTNSNSMNVNSAAAAAAALNLAGLTSQLSNSNPTQQAMAALIQQQMMAAQSMPLMNNHFGSSNNFMSLSQNNSSGNTSKLTR